MIEIGVMAREIRRPTIAALLQEVHDLGFRQVQINLSVLGGPTLPLSIDRGQMLALRRMVDDFDLRIPALSGTFNMAHPDAKVRQLGVQGMAVLCECAEILGAPVITLCTGTRHETDMWHAHPENDTLQAWQDMLSTLRLIMPVAEAHHIRLAFEPETGNVVNTVEKARVVLEEMGSDALGVVMDPANLFTPHLLQNMDAVLERAFTVLGKAIFLAHAKDVAPPKDGERDCRWVGAGQGVLNFRHYFCLLEAAGYRGPWIMHGLTEDAMPAGYRYLQNCMRLEEF